MEEYTCTSNELVRQPYSMKYAGADARKIVPEAPCKEIWSLVVLQQKTREDTTHRNDELTSMQDNANMVIQMWHMPTYVHIQKKKDLSIRVHTCTHKETFQINNMYSTYELQLMMELHCKLPHPIQSKGKPP